MLAGAQQVVNDTTYSIVLPVQNIADRLERLVSECLTVAGRHLADYELIIVDDGSDDGTATQADRLAAANAPVMVLHQPRPRGYGYALRTAWGVARGSYIIVVDSGDSSGIADLPRLLPQLDSHAAVVGYRLKPSRRPEVMLYSAIARALLATDLHDPLLRFGIFRSDLHDYFIDDVPDQLTLAALYGQLQHENLPVAQVGVPGPRGRNRQVTPRALAELLSYKPSGRSPRLDRRKGAALGAGALVVAGGLWLLKRRRS